MSNPRGWLVLTVQVESPEARALAADELIGLGGRSVVEEDAGVTTYLDTDADPETVAAEARERLAPLLPPGEPLEIRWRWQEDEDWARSWKRGLQPRQVTERIVVKPTWTEWTAREGEVVLDVDPQMAFGTGEHATTRGCLRLLDPVLRPGDRVLDVGSGSAILAIAAARLGAAEVLAVEYDPDANLNARENLEQNGVADRVRILEALVDPMLLPTLGRFDVILANILSGIIRPLLPAFRAALGEGAGGRLIVSGILQSEHLDVVRDAAAAGFRVQREDREEEWWSALLVPTS